MQRQRMTHRYWYHVTMYIYYISLYFLICMAICVIIYIYTLRVYIYIRYVYYIYMIPSSAHEEWDGSPGSTPPSLLFESYWQHFWGPASYLLGFCSDSDYQPPASHLLGTCYPLDDLRSTHTPSKYLRATYSHIYMCYVATSYIYTYIFIYWFIYIL